MSGAFSAAFRGIVSKLRVLQVVTRLVVGGAPRHVLHLAAGLDPERYDVEVLAGSPEPGETPIWDEAAALGLRVSRLPDLVRPLAPRRDWAAYRQLCRTFESGYDIVHTHISKAGLLGRLAARRVGVPAVVHTYHGVAEEVRARSWRGGLLRLAERRAAAAADALLAVSRDATDELLAAGIGRAAQFHLVGNGVDTGRFDPGQGESAPLPAGRPVIGTAARLGPEKGIDLLLQAAAILARQHPDLLVCILGDGPLRAELEAEAGRLGIEERVRFVGNVADVRPWLRRFDVVVSPSRSEGLPTLVLEALAMQRPVVATRVGGTPSLIRPDETGLLVPSEEPEALAAAIGRALADPVAAERWGQAGRILVEGEYSMAAVVRRVEAVYESLLARKAADP